MSVPAGCAGSKALGVAQATICIFVIFFGCGARGAEQEVKHVGLVNHCLPKMHSVSPSLQVRWTFLHATWDRIF